MSQIKSSFHPMFTSFAMYADDEDLREIKCGEIFSIHNMSEKEIRQSIIQDILSPTMWEMEKGEKVHFDMVEFLRFVPNTGDRQFVMHQMWHEEIAFMIVGKGNDPANEDGQLRIKNDRATLQAAMDYCGVWADGFDMPEGVLITDVGVADELIDQHGSIENLAKSIYIDSSANAPASKILQ